MHMWNTKPRRSVRRRGEDRSGSGPQLCSPPHQAPLGRPGNSSRVQTKEEEKVDNKYFIPTKDFILTATPFRKIKVIIKSEG